MATMGPPPPVPVPAEATEPKEFQEDLNAIIICPDCKENPPNLVEEFSSGDMVCASCGLVLGDRIIDSRSEWRTFSNDDQGNDDPSRVGDGPNALLDGDQLDTMIAYGAKSKAARALTSAQNKMTQDKNSKALLTAYRDIGTLCDKINAGKNVADAAKLIYKQVDDARFLKGKPTDAIIAGCIFVSCRQLGVGRTFKEIFSLTSVPKKDIGRIFKQLESFLGKSNEKAAKPNQQKYNVTSTTSAYDLCVRYCSNLQFRNPARMEKVSRLLAQKTQGISELAGRSPLSVAAACIYMACHLMGEPRSTKDIALVAGVSDGTVKTAYKFLYARRESLVDVDWLADGGNMEHLPAN